MSEARNKLAVITGGSSGIGLELARCAAADGYDVLIAARAAIKLDQVERDLKKQFGVTITMLQIDLDQPDAAAKVHTAAIALGLPIEVLINCAGFGDSGPYAEMDPANLHDMLMVNMVALAETTRLFLPAMLRANVGYIMNIASIAAFQPGPGMASYYATKAFVLSLTEAISEEISETDVSITTLCPGPTATNFERRAHVHESRMYRARGVMRASDVAIAGWVGMLNGKRIIIPGWRNRAYVRIIRFLPRRIIMRNVKNTQSVD